MELTKQTENYKKDPKEEMSLPNRQKTLNLLFSAKSKLFHLESSVTFFPVISIDRELASIQLLLKVDICSNQWAILNLVANHRLLVANGRLVLVVDFFVAKFPSRIHRIPEYVTWLSFQRG